MGLKPTLHPQLTLHHTFDAWLPPGSEAAGRLELALRSSNTAPLSLSVGARASGEDGQGDIVGKATVHLRQLLAEGGDIHGALLPLLDQQGSICGNLRLSILAQVKKKDTSSHD